MMSSKEVIDQYLADKNADLRASTEDIIERLSEAGFVIVPREPTETMLAAASALPVTKTVDSLLALHLIVTGGVNALPIYPNSPLQQLYRAMIDVAS